MKSEFLDFMVECGALLFGEFTLKSGRKSPYFINTGEYKTGAQLSKLGDFYAKLILNSVEREQILKKFNVLFGPAYKGIPLATATACKLYESGITLNVSFDRKERKDHGESNLIMGYQPKDGDRIAIIEDVTTAGTSVREVMALLTAQKNNAKVVALYVSIDRMERGTGNCTAIEQLKKEYNIDVHSIASTQDIVTYLENSKNIANAKVHAENIMKYLTEYGG